VNGDTIVGPTAAVFDTGSSQILGDPVNIAKLFEAIGGAELESLSGIDYYTSALRCVAASQPITNHFSTP
jgi:hypothetical protein